MTTLILTPDNLTKLLESINFIDNNHYGDRQKALRYLFADLIANGNWKNDDIQKLSDVIMRDYGTEVEFDDDDLSDTDIDLNSAQLNMLLDMLR